METLYFLAVVPPPDVRDAITTYKLLAREAYGSGHALRSPPHITLHMPFRAKDRTIGLVHRKMAEVTSLYAPFSLELRNFGCFAPRVIYVDVEESQELQELREDVVRRMKSLNFLNADYKDKPFSPHVTIAFRDLRKAQFRQAWEHFKSKEFHMKFEVTGLELLRHDGKQWHMHRTYPFPEIT